MSDSNENVNLKAVAVLGAGGTMGRGISRNAAAANISTQVWNRTAAKLGNLAETPGVEAFDTAREAVVDADVVVTMVSDADATLAAMSGPDGGAAGAEGATWVQMGTIGVEGSARCAELAGERGIVYVDAPVLGTKKPAEAGQLVILASGPDEARGRLGPLFDAVGKRTIWVGDAGAGSKLKVVINSWLCAVTEGTAEMLRLASALGIEPHLALDAVEEGPLEAPYMRMKGEMMLTGDYTPSFRLALASKDAGLAVAAGHEAGAEIPMIEAIAAQMATVAEAHPDDDIAALFRGTH